MTESKLKLIGYGDFDFKVIGTPYRYHQQHHRNDEIDFDEAKVVAKSITTAANNHQSLIEVLEVMTEHYVQLAGCGDCGFWNPEEEEEVIAARAALLKVKEKADAE